MGVEPTRPSRSKRWSNREELARIDLHWHDLEDEALSRLGDEGVPCHELHMPAGYASITTTQRYGNARANSVAIDPGAAIATRATTHQRAGERRASRLTHDPPSRSASRYRLSVICQSTACRCGRSTF